MVFLAVKKDDTSDIKRNYLVLTSFSLIFLRILHGNTVLTYSHYFLPPSNTFLICRKVVAS